jgi:hypothetical protein
MIHRQHGESRPSTAQAAGTAPRNEHVHRPFEFETEINGFDLQQLDPLAIQLLVFTA